MRTNRLRNWAIVSVVCALLSVGYRLTADGQVPVIGSLVTGFTGQFGNLVSACNGCGQVTWTPGAFTQGSWMAQGNEGGSNLETDFINFHPSADVGGWAWFAPTSSTLGSPVMTLSTGGTLTVAQVAGNASTATNATNATNATHATTAGALSGSLSQCPNGASGIAANGNAVCISATYQVESLTITTGICTTPNTAYAQCGPIGPYTWSTAFPDANYAVSCSSAVPTSTSGGSTVGVITVYIENISATGVSLELQNGTGTGAGANTTGTIFCTAQHA